MLKLCENKFYSETHQNSMSFQPLFILISSKVTDFLLLFLHNHLKTSVLHCLSSVWMYYFSHPLHCITLMKAWCNLIWRHKILNYVKPKPKFSCQTFCSLSTMVSQDIFESKTCQSLSMMDILVGYECTDFRRNIMGLAFTLLNGLLDHEITMIILSILSFF